jgi:phosphatidylserine decarboxylase
MASEPIQYFNRYTGRIETEQVYGAGYLQFIYGNPLGKLALHGLVKRAAFSRWYGRRMSAPASRMKIGPFVSNYGLNAAEFADDPGTFRNFNEFFFRKLKPGARPIDGSARSAVFPADGRHLGFQDMSKNEGIFVKGARLDLEQLFADRELAARYRGGSLVLSRLCPVDYHRFHFPVGGLPEKPRLINGHLLSVNPIALRQNIKILVENKRFLSLIESPTFGRVATFEVGATNVGSVEYTFLPGVAAAKGAEKGFFKFGGSLTITLFEKGAVRLDNDLTENARQGRELYARMGDRMGEGG